MKLSHLSLIHIFTLQHIKKDIKVKIQEKKYLALPHLLQGKDKGIVNLKNLAGGGIVCGLNADLTGICLSLIHI